jgi:hypothetical protein
MPWTDLPAVEHFMLFIVIKKVRLYTKMPLVLKKRRGLNPISRRKIIKIYLLSGT